MDPSTDAPPAPDGALPWLGADEIRARVTPDRAREVVHDVLAGGFDPADDPARSNTPAGSGHLLIMPTTVDGWVGIKVASVAPDNPARGLPRIQATYLLLDAETLTPRMILDGSVLTELRTPAISAVAVDQLARADARHLLILGSGPQARGHVRALAGVRAFDRIAVAGRSPDRAEATVRTLVDEGMPAVVCDLAEAGEADVIVCATSSATPLFDGSLVRDDACVVAIGSHEPDRRELDSAMMGRAQVVVEDHQTAMRECGDVVLAVDEGALSPDDLVGLAAVVRGEVPVARDRPVVFKGAGMAWQDLAVAIAAVEGARVSPSGSGP
ncbi:ornithine cyclodeaminase family protein [Janibacter cremeus]|uniref:Ornithine cyclodeaminase n=1 Tax=Janibacter cremeus TaxID=1285192 RepID=A0A852VWK5_9MICO|nr:ornithine cyclodeaminase family protein [Janibacter cremeus]NYF98155.1 ornithine cyclodeaminase [Janibacter cremeus]